MLIPVYDYATGELMYGSTPAGPALWPAHANDAATAPFYLVVYPVGSTVGVTQCQDVPVENCPDHGPLVATGAQAFEPAVYGAGVLGHDHLSPPQGKGFKVTCEPVLVLFTNKAAANQHLTTKAQVEAAAARGDVIVLTHEDWAFTGLPNLTFVNAIVSAAVYEHGTPVA